MAGPTISESMFNPFTLVVTIKWSAQITSFSGAAHDVVYTHSDGIAYSNPGTALLTNGGANGIISMQLAADPNATPDAGALDIAVGAFTSGGGTSLAISTTINGFAIDHPAPYTRTDVLALNAALVTFVGVGSGGTVSTTTIQLTDIGLLNTHLLGTTGVLAKAPKALKLAADTLTALGTFMKSGNDQGAKKDFFSISGGLSAAMPAAGSFAITSAGT